MKLDDGVCRYDVGTDTWAAIAPMQQQRFSLGTAALDGCIYALGGFSEGYYQSSAERMDPREGR